MALLTWKWSYRRSSKKMRGQCPPEMIQIFAETLDDPNPSIRRASAIGLRWCGPNAVSHLIPRLDDPSEQVRVAILKALGHLGTADAIDALANAGIQIPSHVEIQRLKAFWRAEQLPVQCVSEILSHLHDSRLDVVLNALRALTCADQLPLNVEKRLTELQDEPRMGIDMLATCLLGWIDPPPLGRIVESFKNSEWKVRWGARYAVTALLHRNRISVPQTIDIILADESDPSALGVFGVEHQPELMAELGSPDSRRRELVSDELEFHRGVPGYTHEDLFYIGTAVMADKEPMVARRGVNLMQDLAKIESLADLATRALWTCFTTTSDTGVRQGSRWSLGFIESARLLSKRQANHLLAEFLERSGFRNLDVCDSLGSSHPDEVRHWILENFYHLEPYLHGQAISALLKLPQTDNSTTEFLLERLEDSIEKGIFPNDAELRNLAMILPAGAEEFRRRLTTVLNHIRDATPDHGKKHIAVICLIAIGDEPNIYFCDSKYEAIDLATQGSYFGLDPDRLRPLYENALDKVFAVSKHELLKTGGAQEYGELLRLLYRWPGQIPLKAVRFHRKTLRLRLKTGRRGMLLEAGLIDPRLMLHFVERLEDPNPCISSIAAHTIGLIALRRFRQADFQYAFLQAKTLMIDLVRDANTPVQVRLALIKALSRMAI